MLGDIGDVALDADNDRGCTEMSSTEPIPYAGDVRPQDTERALETVTVALFPNETNPLAIDFHGTCPRCGDRIQVRRWLVAVAGSLKMNDKQMEALASHLNTLGVDSSRGDETFDLSCSCDVEHPHHLPGQQGCGARFRVRVTWP